MHGSSDENLQSLGWIREPFPLREAALGGWARAELGQAQRAGL